MCARLARRLVRWFRFAVGMYVSLAVCLASAFTQDVPQKRRVRFIDGRVELCEVVSADAAGVTLRLDRVPRPVKFGWWQLDPEDAEAIRGGGAAEPSRPERTLPGIRVRTRDGRVHEGLSLPGAPAGEIWIKNAEGRTVIRAEESVSREDARVPVQRVYSPDELFTYLAGRIRPSAPEDFDRLAAELVRARLPDRAGAVVRMSEILRSPLRPESRLARDLARLRDSLEGMEARRAAFEAQEGCLAGDYDMALERLAAVEGGLPTPLPPEALAEVRRLRGLLQELRGAAREDRIVREWHLVFDTLLRVKAMDRGVSFAEASVWVERTLPEEVERRVRARFNFTPGDPEARRAWERRPAENMLRHSVGGGSWMELAPAARPQEEWWSAADDASRYGVLKGLAVERHMQVIAKELKGCPGCGGTGLAAGPGGPGDVCPSCIGTKCVRVFIYR